MLKLLSAGLIAVLLLVGCGGGDDDGATAGGSGSDSASANSESASDAGSGGSDSSDGSGETASIGKAAFVKKAEAICKATVGDVLSKAGPVIEKELGVTPKYDAASEKKREAVESRLVTEVMAPALRSEVEQLEALGVPPGDEEQVNEILDSIQDLVTRTTNNADALVDYNSEEMAASNALAERYGLKECPYG
jgi:hypothetical protein